MARKRMISPDFWADPKIAKLTIAERLLFVGLISNANDYGKLRGQPWIIKGHVFPADTITIKQVDHMLEAIRRLELIERYKIKGESYIKLCNWDRHQKLHHPAKDEHPDPASGNTPVDFGKPSGDLPAQVKSSQSKLSQVKSEEVKRSQGGWKEPLPVETVDNLDGHHAERLLSISQKLTNLTASQRQALLTKYMAGFFGTGERAGQDYIVTEWDHLVGKIAKAKDVKNWPAYAIKAVEKYHEERSSPKKS